MDWRVFWGTLGKFYGTAYGIVFAMWILLTAMGVEIKNYKPSTIDLVFALWAFGTALWKASHL
jgi:hypothetical protein